MMITIKLTCDNAAFEDDNGPGEVARILRTAANRFENLERLDDESFTGFRLFDVNGNRVGAVEVME